MFRRRRSPFVFVHVAGVRIHPDMRGRSFGLMHFSEVSLPLLVRLCMLFQELVLGKLRNFHASIEERSCETEKENYSGG